MTTIFLPAKSGISLSPMARSISTALMTCPLSSPGMPVFLSVWAPMEMYTLSYRLRSSSKGMSLPTSTSVWTVMPRDRMESISRSSSSRGKR